MTTVKTKFKVKRNIKYQNIVKKLLCVVKPFWVSYISE